MASQEEQKAASGSADGLGLGFSRTAWNVGVLIVSAPVLVLETQ